VPFQLILLPHVNVHTFFFFYREILLLFSWKIYTMATLKDIGVAAAINILSAFIFLVVFAILRLQPFNDRVYFPKWYHKGLRTDPTHSGAYVRRFVNLDFRSYIRFLNWMPGALRMPEPELIDHAGLDSAVYLRIYLIGYVANVVKFVLEQCLCESVGCNILLLC
jgi:hypothetical protein